MPSATPNLRNVNGELLTEEQVLTRTKYVRELIDYAGDRYGCCGALHDFRNKIYNCSFSRLQEYVSEMIKWRQGKGQETQQAEQQLPVATAQPTAAEEVRQNWRQLIENDNPFDKPSSVTGEQ